MRHNPALAGAERVVFVESRSLLKRPYLHRQRAHVVLSGMRHFAAELRSAGVSEVVEYRDATSLGAVVGSLAVPVIAASPNSRRAQALLARHGVSTVPSNQFLTDPAAFRAWAQGRRRVTMEDFYRDQRRRFDVLVEPDGRPVGGQWNFDAENRQSAAAFKRAAVDPPAPWMAVEDAIDAEVRETLDALPWPLWGDDAPRRYAVTPAEAAAALQDFVAHRLPQFGPWQDTMMSGQSVLFHALLSVPLNLGVIDPLSVVQAAATAYDKGSVALSSAEGFIRQVLGWREYMWGTYWARSWDHVNALDAQAPLPSAFHSGRSGWECLDATVAAVGETGYAHHIERLMVLGNIMLLAEVDPKQATAWFAQRFVDGAEWVMAPNAAGMALYADGGLSTTKPYAAGGNYINRMSDHCGRCCFDPKQRSGPQACPLTALYWDFVGRNRERLATNRRMSLPLRNERGFDEEARAGIAARAARARRELDD